MKKVSEVSASERFSKILEEYKLAIDADIADFAESFRANTDKLYGDKALLDTNAFLDILSRGGKRIRGALTMVSYEMYGGKDSEMILFAARAIEMNHAYILMVDDFQDRSALRRGDRSAHTMLADYHRQHRLSGEAEHFGASLALDGALVGSHASQIEIISLNVDADRKLKVLEVLNQTMIATGHGQSADILNEVSANVTGQDVEHVMEWKTVNYTFFSPISIGMILAGANDEDIKSVWPYVVNAGMAYQITDDALGIFGDQAVVGKDPVDDIREGKRTLLVVHALENSAPADKAFLLEMLGNEHITSSQFEKCKVIIEQSGALDFSQAETSRHISEALVAVSKMPSYFSDAGKQFLSGLAEYILARKF